MRLFDGDSSPFEIEGQVIEIFPRLYLERFLAPLNRLVLTALKVRTLSRVIEAAVHLSFLALPCLLPEVVLSDLINLKQLQLFIDDLMVTFRDVDGVIGLDIRLEGALFRFLDHFDRELSLL